MKETVLKYLYGRMSETVEFRIDEVLGQHKLPLEHRLGSSKQEETQ
jgi:hypothetical protein